MYSENLTQVIKSEFKCSITTVIFEFVSFYDFVHYCYLEVFKVMYFVFSWMKVINSCVVCEQLIYLQLIIVIAMCFFHIFAFKL